MSWLTFAVLAMLAKSGQNFAEKAGQKKFGSFLTTLLLIVLSSLIVIPYTIFSSPLPSVNIMFWVGVVGAVLVYLIAKPMRLFALGTGDISEIVPLVSFSSLFSLIFGWVFLNEVPTKWGLLGVGFIAIGGYLMNFEYTKEGISKVIHPVRQVFKQRTQSLLFMSIILGPITSVFDKLAINNTFPRSPHYALTAENVLIIPPLIFLLFYRKTRLDKLKHFSNWKIPLLLGLLFAIQSLLSFSAMSVGNIGYVSAIKQLASLVAVVGGFIFLGEVKFRQRMISAAVMASGAFLISYLG